MADIQGEKAYKKQKQVFENKHLVSGKTSAGTRFYKKIGFGFKTPSEAIKGTYIDHKCPFTSDITIRGALFKAVVISKKMKSSIVVRRDYFHYIPKYNRYEKRHSNMTVHVSPCFRVSVGDVVTIGQCRPLSKTIRFNVLKVEEKNFVGNIKKKFVMF